MVYVRKDNGFRFSITTTQITSIFTISVYQLLNMADGNMSQTVCNS